MGFFIGLLTVVMVLDCLILTLLVLMQLPKKDAGAGLAFGGTATDALFGAGSGNFLTKATKYAAGIFFALTVSLMVLQNHYEHRGNANFLENLQRPSAAVPIEETPRASAPAPAAPAAPAAAPANNNLLIPVPAAAPSNTAAPKR
jgi:preprotein translocase subunit SecG